MAGATYIFCLPGSPGACQDAWDEILVHQLDYRYRPCNFVEIMPRLDEHLRRPKAQGATAVSIALRSRRHHGAAAQHDDAAAAQAAQEFSLRIGVLGAMAAEPLVERLARSASPAAGAAAPPMRAAMSPSASTMAEPSVSASPVRRNAAARASGRPLRSALLDEAPVSSIQVQSGTAPGRRNMSHGARAPGRRLPQALPQRAAATLDPAAGDIGDHGGRVVRSGVRHDHLAHDAGGRARHQRGQRRHQDALRRSPWQ